MKYIRIYKKISLSHYSYYIRFDVKIEMLIRM